MSMFDMLKPFVKDMISDIEIVNIGDDYEITIKKR